MISARLPTISFPSRRKSIQCVDPVDVALHTHSRVVFQFQQFHLHVDVPCYRIDKIFLANIHAQSAAIIIGCYLFIVATFMVKTMHALCA